MASVQKAIIKLVIGFTLTATSIALAREPTLKWGLGVRSCAQFSLDFQSDPELWETLYYVWAEGYMTGFTAARLAFQEEDIDLNPYERDEQWRRESIRNYCATNPLAPYSEAVVNLMVELNEESSR